MTEWSLLGTPPQASIDWAVRRIGPSRHLISVEPLRGGMSHGNHLLHFDPGPDFVLRRWVRPDWQTYDPEFSPEQEAATYALLAESRVPAPRLVAADIKGEWCDVPALLLTRARGSRQDHPSELTSFVRDLAGVLPLIHEIDARRAAAIVPPFRRYYEPERLAIPLWTKQPEVWRRAIGAVSGPLPDEPAVFIHRDYHQGNTLWADDHLTAVVDWTSAEFGSASMDVAHMRANLAMSFSIEAADAFLQACESAGVVEWFNPFWDLLVVTDFLPELPFPGRGSAENDRIESFVATALGKL